MIPNSKSCMVEPPKKKVAKWWLRVKKRDKNMEVLALVRNYLLDFHASSAHYGSLNRFIEHEPTLPDSDPDENFYWEDNLYITSGQPMEFKEPNLQAMEAFEKGQDVHMQASPSQAELLFKNHQVIKEELKFEIKETMMERYAGVALSEAEISQGPFRGPSLQTVKAYMLINNHTTIWDSDCEYKCCKQKNRYSYCTGAAGINAAEAATDLIKANIARKETTEDKPAPAPVEGKKLATSGTDMLDSLDDLIFDQERLSEALEKEDQRKKEERDERKQKYKEKYNDEETVKEYMFINNHTTVWGSFWEDHHWGYKCCKQMNRYSYCTGATGVKAAEAATDLIRANIARKEITEDKPAPAPAPAPAPVEE